VAHHRAMSEATTVVGARLKRSVRRMKAKAADWWKQMGHGSSFGPAATLTLLAMVCPPALASAPGPIWAREAVAITVKCGGGQTQARQRVASPDGSTTLELLCRNSTRDDEGLLLRAVRGDRTIVLVPVVTSDDSWRPQELLWAPDSTAFFINGSPSAYAGFAFVVYRVAANSVTPVDVTNLTQRDMVRTFPPCRARSLSDAECGVIEEKPEFNMSALAWSHGDAAVIVFGEVPCSGQYGGIACQVMGYEVAVPTGTILQRLSAPELKRRCQSDMAWPMKMPDPPQYRSPGQHD